MNPLKFFVPIEPLEGTAQQNASAIVKKFFGENVEF